METFFVTVILICTSCLFVQTIILVGFFFLTVCIFSSVKDLFTFLSILDCLFSHLKIRVVNVLTVICVTKSFDMIYVYSTRNKF